jgi:hypothetical protein
MRQIYTSQREENIDRVVALMKEAGIETTLTNRRNYGGHDFRGPSYSQKVDRETWPQVWVVHAEDQTRARAILREIGIAPPTRFVDEVAASRNKEIAPAQRRVAFAWRVRTALLLAIVILVLLNWTGVLHLF